MKNISKKNHNILTIVLLSTAMFFQFQSVNAQADTLSAWKKGAVLNLSLSQTSLTNWQGGGQNSIAANALFSGFANYKKGKNSFDNSIDIGYGMLQQGKAGLIKSDDKIDINTKYGRSAFKHFYYACLLNGKSQIAPGYNYPNDSIVISRFFAPAYVLASIGIDYKPASYLTAYLSPITLKTTIVNDPKLNQVRAFGVDSGKVFRNEVGAYFRAQFEKDIMSNIRLKTKIELFSNYKESPQNIDVNWEALLSMKVNKFISATLSTTLIYDDNIKISVDKNNDGIVDAIGPRTQFKEIFGIGLSYKF